MVLFHGSKDVVEKPEIRTARYYKDFYFGFTVHNTGHKLNDGRCAIPAKVLSMNTNTRRMTV